MRGCTQRRAGSARNFWFGNVCMAERSRRVAAWLEGLNHQFTGDESFQAPPLPMTETKTATRPMPNEMHSMPAPIFCAFLRLSLCLRSFSVRGGDLV